MALPFTQTREPHLLRDILLDGILIAAVDPVQLKAEVDVVPHVVLVADMLFEALHSGSQGGGEVHRTSPTETLAAANIRDRLLSIDGLQVTARARLQHIFELSTCRNN